MITIVHYIASFEVFQNNYQAISIVIYRKILEDGLVLVDNQLCTRGFSCAELDELSDWLCDMLKLPKDSLYNIPVYSLAKSLWTTALKEEFTNFINNTAGI